MVKRKFDPKKAFVPLVGDFVPAPRRKGRGSVPASVQMQYEYPVERGGLEEGIMDNIPAIILGVVILGFFFAQSRR